MASLQINLNLKRKDFTLSVDTELPVAGVTAIYGESGSGKTTLLRSVAGLEASAKGVVKYDREVWQDQARFVPTHKRPVGYVFQEASLFPHLSGQKNLDFALKRSPKRLNNKEINNIINILGIDNVLPKLPAQMSGGERQRIAIARALLVNPELLLMDEPLASLDQSRKSEILPYLEKLKRELKLPILYVTHSQDEVVRLADHLVVMEKGRIKYSGALNNALSSLDFPVKFGEEAGVVLDATVAERDEKWHLAKISIQGADFWFRDNGFPVGQKIRIRVLARDVSLSRNEHRDSSILNVMPTQVVAIGDDEHAGLKLVQIRIGDQILLSRLTARSADKLGIEAGQKLWAQVKSVAIAQ